MSTSLASLSGTATSLSATILPGTPAPPQGNQQPNQPTKPPALPTPTHVAASSDTIDIDYTYTSELITVIYPLYGSVLDNYLTVVLTNTADTSARLVVQSEISGYTDQALDTIDIDAGGSTVVRQNPRLRPETIDKLNSSKPASFHIRIAFLDNGVEKTVIDETKEITLFGRRDFPWGIQGLSEHEDFELLASMVMPNDPAVEGLIRAAANYMPNKSMGNGYSGIANDEQGKVWSRLEALWKAEANDYHLTYISTLVTYAPGDVQRIRLPSEVLDQSSGNCVELAVLFASAAEALDLETALIRIPGHAYMAVRMDNQNKNYYVVETTLIGQTSFSKAVSYGSKEFYDALPHLDAGDQYYDWITISDARKKGILPLPWH